MYDNGTGNILCYETKALKSTKCGKNVLTLPELQPVGPEELIHLLLVFSTIPTESVRIEKLSWKDEGMGVI